MVQHNEYVMPNPDDGITTFQKTRVYRAPDVAGAPGVFASIALVDIDPFNENTVYVDANGLPTSWYKHRHEATGGAPVSDDYPVIQFGDYLARRWIKADIKDADLSDNVLWDHWRDQTIQIMRLKGLGRPADIQEITATGTTELYGLNADIRRVQRMELYNSAGEFLAVWNSWKQRGRQVRIFRPRGGFGTPAGTFTWKVYGLGELRCLSDLDDELHVILKWGMKMHYAGWRKHQRLDIRPFMARTKQSDVTSTRDFASVEADSAKMFYMFIEDALQPEGASHGGGVA